MKSFSDAMEES